MNDVFRLVPLPSLPHESFWIYLQAEIKDVDKSPNLRHKLRNYLNLYAFFNLSSISNTMGHSSASDKMLSKCVALSGLLVCG